MSKYLARKFILTLLCLLLTIILGFKHIIEASNIVSLILGILAFYHGADTVQHHSAFKPPIPQLPDQSITEEEPEDKEDIIDRLKHGG